MTRKDYIRIARAIRHERETFSDADNKTYTQIALVLERVAYGLARELRDDNSRFDLAKFMKATGSPDYIDA